MTGLNRQDDVYVLDLGDGENRLSLDLLDAVEQTLDEVEAAPAPRALVTTATGKTWSQGLDLDWLTANADQYERYLTRVHGLLSRVLTIGVPTVAAVGGHAYAAGAMLALAHDTVVMRADRGYFCLPEVDLGLPFTDAMDALITARLTPATAHEAMTTGRRYDGEDARAAGIVAEAVPEADVVPRAVKRAAALAGKDPATLRAIKARLYQNVTPRMVGAA